MQFPTVVEHRYMRQDVLPGFIAYLVVTPLNPLPFQAGKEALGHTAVQEFPSIMIQVKRRLPQAIEYSIYEA